MAHYSAFLGRAVEVQYRAGDICLPASGTFVADSGRSIFLEQHYEQCGQQKNFRWEKNALFVAPLAKGGIITVTGDRQTAEAQQFGHDDVFNFYSLGAMLGHFRLHARKKRGSNEYEANPNIAPELISWLTLSMGRWENFEIEVPTGEKDAMGNDIKVRQRPWRYEALGRLKIPETPIIIGFDGNFGKGPDDLRFIFGTRFDIGKIMHTLKLAGAQDSMGRSTPPPSANTTP